jgi:hypothetical protein
MLAENLLAKIMFQSQTFQFGSGQFPRFQRFLTYPWWSFTALHYFRVLLAHGIVYF